MPFHIADSDLILAPLAGYTEAGFRTLCHTYGAGLCYTEMVSAKGLYYGNENTGSLLHIGAKEGLVGAQIFGSDKDIIAEVLGYEVLKKFPIIDINMGCPVPKVVKNGDGCALMRDPTLVYAIVREAKRAIGERLLTVKIRAGFYNGYENAQEVACAIEEGGADMVTVHGRTREMFYGGSADLGIIQKVKAAVKLPVTGNGDVKDFTSYLRMKEMTGVDYVMIGRGALGRPYVFSELTGKPYQFKLREAVKMHMEELYYLPERVMVNSMKKHVAYYVKGKKGHKIAKEKVFCAETAADVLSAIDLADEI